MALERAFTWRGLDTPRMEFAEVRLDDDGLRARGVQIGTGGVAPGEREDEVVDVPGRYRLDYEVRTDRDLVTVSVSADSRGPDGEHSLRLERSSDGEWRDGGVAIPEVSGALDCDLGLSPLTNFMPIRRHRLTSGGDGRDFVMAWIAVPGLTVHRSEQRYEPIDARTVRYVGEHGSFVSELRLDEDGFAELFPGLGERV